MKFVFYSHHLHFPPIATRLQDKGYQVLFADMTKEEVEPDEVEEGGNELEQSFIDRLEEKRQLIGRGMITSMPAEEVTKLLLGLPDSQKKDYLIFFDFNHGFQFGEKLKQAGFKGFFAEKWGYNLERDRGASNDLVKKLYPEVKTPKVVNFGKGSSQKIEEFIEKNCNQIWVIKPNGEELEVFCPRSDQPAIASAECLDFIEDNRSDIEKTPMIIQEKIIGVEINIETGYSNGSPLWSAVDIENKYMLPGEQGSQTGCSYDLVKFVPLDCELRRICNAPFDEVVKRHSLTTIMDMNVIISFNDGCPYFIEFCPNRFGYNALFTELEIYGENKIDEFLVKWIDGSLQVPIYEYGASIRNFNMQADKMFYESIIKEEYKPVEVRLKSEKGVWLWDCYKEKGHYYLSHHDKNSLIVTAHSDTPEGAVTKVLRKSNHGVDFEGQYYRDDFDEFDKHYNPVYRLRWLEDKQMI